MAVRLNAEQVKQLREIYGRGGSRSEVAAAATQHFGVKVTGSAVQYWCETNPSDMPMSERQDKLNKATYEECLEDLRRVAKIDPTKVVSRNHYRNEGKYSDSAWSQYFGTFEEFKRQAQVIISRHARRMELNIAKHASVDIMRAMTEEKRGWGEKYKRPNNKRFRTHLGASDVHDYECDPFWRTTFLDTARRVQPDVIDLNGDIFDLPEFGKYGVDPREWDVVGRIKWVHKFLEELREAAPDAEMNFIEGNHEFRLLRHLAEATPAMKAVLSDLHGFTVPKLLGLDRFEMNYVAPADLAVFTHKDAAAQTRRNFLIHYGFYAVCHFPEAEKYGMPGWNGHHHKYHAKTYFNPTFGPYQWVQSGGGHKREASYCNGEKWSTGFLLTHLDIEKKSAQFEYLDTSHDHVIIGGQFYQRQ